jgi:nucleoside 2-deoxyribosyltransferase
VRLIYVAGPYTADPERCTLEAMDAADALEDAGYVAFIPHLSHFRHQRRPRDYRHWMTVDLAWLAKCDALLRLPGHSPGADEEVAFAQGRGLPVFHSLHDLVAHW